MPGKLILVGVITHETFHPPIGPHGLISAPAVSRGDTMYNFVTLDVPGSAETLARGISGDTVVGTWFDAANTPQGFSETGGTYTTWSVPGASSGDGYGTWAGGISANTVVGFFGNQSGTYGFIKTGGTYTTVSFPGSNATYAEAFPATPSSAGSLTAAQSTVSYTIQAPAPSPPWMSPDQYEPPPTESPATSLSVLTIPPPLVTGTCIISPAESIQGWIFQTQ